MIIKTNWKNIKKDLAQNIGSYLVVYPFGQLEIVIEQDDSIAEEARIIFIDENIEDVYEEAIQAKKQFEIENEAISSVMSALGKKSAQKRNVSSEQMSELAKKRWRTMKEDKR